MSTIGPADNLLAYLRTQVVGPQRRVVAPAATSAQKTSAQRRKDGFGSPDGSTHATAATQEQAATMLRRVAAIDASDPDRRRKVFRLFLESVLLAEWGHHLINDPGFGQLVDQVQAQMESREELRSLMDQAADQLVDQLGEH